MSPSRVSRTGRRPPPPCLALPKPYSSQRVNVTQLLLHSPLPSPSLPSILPRHGKKPPRLNARRAIRYLLWLASLATILVIAQNYRREKTYLSSSIYQSADGQQYEFLGASDLPDYPTPVAMTDRHGKPRWTISIPEGLEHPLPPSVYQDICASAEDVSNHVASITSHNHNSRNWGAIDPNFVDVAEAQSTGLLPSSPFSSLTGNDNVCTRSLTFVLDASHAGLGHTLMSMWMSWAWAKKEDRAFFIDDTNFPFGNFSSLVGTRLPQPKCTPPRWEERTPCPRQAKHLIVTGGTADHVFGRLFRDGHSVKEVYGMAREGFEALFKLRDDDERHVASRLSKLRHSSLDENRKLVGVHIRRGDRHPWEFQYQHGYIPSEKYMTTAKEMAGSDGDAAIVLASDDADLYHQLETDGAIRAQEHIRLASKRHLQEGGLGWEGGFFSDAFWSVGTPEHVVKKKSAGSPQPTQARQKPLDMALAQSELDEQRDYKSHPTPETRQLREYIGRAYLLDLSVLAGSDSIVCAVSSKTCRILAIMMGWDKFQAGHWKNVDGDYGWIGL